MSATTTVSMTKINKARVRSIPKEGDDDTRPIKGYEICPHLYANIYLVAKKESGKTTLIWNFIDRCAGRDTKIVAFVSTLNNDANWRMIQQKCEEKGIVFIGSTSIMDDEKVDHLQALTHHLQEIAADSDEEKPSVPVPAIPHVSLKEPPPESKKPTKLKYRAPEYIIILDDLSDELKKKSVETLLKKNRHFKCKVIISSQWLNDITPAALVQMSIMCLLRGFSVDKLLEFHSKARLNVSTERFVEMYKDATSEPFGFLYIDMDKGKYRNRFDREYSILE